jgi:hypothetical protein
MLSSFHKSSFEEHLDVTSVLGKKRQSRKGGSFPNPTPLLGFEKINLHKVNEQENLHLRNNDTERIEWSQQNTQSPSHTKVISLCRNLSHSVT